MPVNFTQRIKTAYLDALYAFLDGLVHVAFSEPPDTTLNSSGLPADQSQQARKADISALVGLLECISRLDTREC